MKAEQQQHNWVFSPAFVYFLASFLLLGSIASLYAWLVFTPFARTPYGVPSLGCQEGNEGSWSIGFFYGSSPFSLQPIEDVSVNPFYSFYCSLNLCFFCLNFLFCVFRRMCGRMRVQHAQLLIQWSLVLLFLRLVILVTLLLILFFIFK